MMTNIDGQSEKTIKMQIMAWLILPVFMIKTWIYYWQINVLDLMNIWRYLRILASGEDVPAYEMICVYEAPIITILVLLAIYAIGVTGRRSWHRFFFYISYTLITLLMLADAAYSSYFGRCVSINQIRQIGSLFQILDRCFS